MRLLIPYDGSEQAEKAIQYAVAEHGDDEIVLMHVLDFIEAGYDSPPESAAPRHWDEWYEEVKTHAREMLDDVAGSFDGTVETEIVIGQPSRTIVEYAEENDIDAIVMGSHGRDGLSRILLGSVAETVVRRSPIPVTVVR